jgi:hypothetical protein
VQPLSSLLYRPSLWHASRRDAAITIEIGKILGCCTCYAPGRALGVEGQLSPAPASIQSHQSASNPQTGMVIPASCCCVNSKYFW